MVCIYICIYTPNMYMHMFIYVQVQVYIVYMYAKVNKFTCAKTEGRCQGLPQLFCGIYADAGSPT